MSIKIAINGFGRIGRSAFKSAINRDLVDVVAINDLVDTKTLSHLLKYDSVFGKQNANISYDSESICYNDKKVQIFSERDPSNLPWNELGIDVVIESTGFFTKRDQAASHLKAGAKKVLISAPSSDADITLVLGVNINEYDSESHHVLSMGSCTTNAAVPVIKTLHDTYGVEKGMMTTTHSYTSDQKLIDAPHKDPRRSRAASLNIIPTSTGAAKAVVQVLPELKGKFDALALRVPVPNVSVIDFTVTLKQNVNVEHVNQTLKNASQIKYKGLMEYIEEPLVSQDFLGNTSVSIIDGLLTTVTDQNLVKIISWYDNESGYSTKLIDLIETIIER